MKRSLTVRTGPGVVLAALLAAVLLPVFARAYDYPPEKLVQYWAARVYRYGAFEVKGQHLLHAGLQNVTPDVAEARILFGGDGRFRLDRLGKGVVPYTVIGDESRVVVIRNGILPGPEADSRYDFGRFFSISKAVSAERRQQFVDAGMVLDSGPVLWLLAHLADMGVLWKKARLAPYGTGQIAAILGRDEREPVLIEPKEAEQKARNEVWFDNHEFYPLEVRRIVPLDSGPVPYRVVLNEYENDILKYFPRRITIYVNGQLAEEFVLSSASLQPKFKGEELDLEKVKVSLLPPPAKKETPPSPETKGKPQ